MIYLFASVIGIYLIFAIIITIGIYRLPVSKAITSQLPSVSVLVSCRNEERDVVACVRSLTELDYPAEKLQIILIDDLSTDSTPDILKKAATEHSNIEFYSSSEFPTTHLEAKARGISFAASKATGEWLFITDADCEVPSTWLKHMLDGVDEKTGIITGAMDTKNDNLIGSLERIASCGRLLFGFGISGFGMAFHALGPNMAIRKSVYDSGGGLEKADFRIAEDIALFRLSHDQGFKTTYHYDKYTRVLTTAVANFDQLQSQQVRWLIGGLEKAGVGLFLVILILEIIFFPMIVGFIYFFATDFVLALLFLTLKSLSEVIMSVTFKHRMAAKKNLRLLPLAFFYTFYIYIWIPLIPLIKRTAAWKGDDYEVIYK